MVKIIIFCSSQQNLDKVCKFWENYPAYGNNIKHKKLSESIEIAKKILKGETTYEYERDKIAEIQAISFIFFKKN